MRARHRHAELAENRARLRDLDRAFGLVRASIHAASMFPLAPAEVEIAVFALDQRRAQILDDLADVEQAIAELAAPPRHHSL